MNSSITPESVEPPHSIAKRQSDGKAVPTGLGGIGDCHPGGRGFEVGCGCELHSGPAQGPLNLKVVGNDVRAYPQRGRHLPERDGRGQQVTLRVEKGRSIETGFIDPV